jgi:hypothetical protein
MGNRLDLPTGRYLGIDFVMLSTDDTRRRVMISLDIGELYASRVCIIDTQSNTRSLMFLVSQLRG